MNLGALGAYRNSGELMLDERSDEALMALCRDGHPDAFRTLVRRYEKRLYNYIRRMVANAADAEDLFQEAFLRIYRHRNRFREGAPFRPWAYRIATNLCRDHLRKQRRRGSVSLDAPANSNGLSLLDRAESPAPGPVELAEEAELAERLAAAVDRLSVKHRAVFLMARYDGMEYKEIAQALRVPVGTVKSRMNKAVNLLMAAVREGAE